MSSAALRRMPAPGTPCPCGSGEVFGACCSPIVDGEPAATAETLMRSRYTAFALGHDDHLFRSWHPRTRPAPPYADPLMTWESLRILGVVAGAEGDDEGVVEFEARWRATGGRTGAMRERSTFARRGGRWVYVDGEVDDV